MRIWGIDGGQTGSAVRIAEDGLTALDCIEWKRRRDPPMLPIEPGDVVALEAAYVGENERSALTLQLWRGKLIGTMPECGRGVHLLEPLATTWRAKVLKRARMRRDQAKETAMSVAKQHALGLPEEYEDHTAEAWLIARFAWGWARTHLAPDGSLLVAARRAR